ncbi:MAG: winged helix-turn-helix transcriptional regulator [Prevotella sp.]|jgi:DNA-binding HxlR family transcriptional regulator
MVRRQVTDPVFPQCPIRNVLARIGDRWSLLTLLALQDTDKPLRFKELSKAIPDVSQKMLAATLKELEADDLVNRQAYVEIPPRVEYSLTERGKSLMPLLNQLVEWSLGNMSVIIASRKKYVEEHGN